MDVEHIYRVGDTVKFGGHWLGQAKDLVKRLGFSHIDFDTEYTIEQVFHSRWPRVEQPDAVTLVELPSMGNGLLGKIWSIEYFEHVEQSTYCSLVRERLHFISRGGGWIDTVNWNKGLPSSFSLTSEIIEERASWSQSQGPQPLWKGYNVLPGYNADSETRTSNDVRSTSIAGAFYAALAALKKPRAIVEIGTAFGVSGMYWLAGLERAGAGLLHTYEPNDVWSSIAEENLRAISNRYLLTKGTFEDNAETTLAGTTVDIALIDAIHTTDVVMSQFSILKNYLAPGAIVLLDDISFSDGMRACWEIAQGLPGVVSVAVLEGRLGILEFE